VAAVAGFIREEDLHPEWHDAVAARQIRVPIVNISTLWAAPLYQIPTVEARHNILLGHAHYNGHPATLLRLADGRVAIFKGVRSPEGILSEYPVSYAGGWLDALGAITRGAQAHAFYWPAKRIPLSATGDGRTHHYIVWRDEFIPIRMFSGGFKFNRGDRTHTFDKSPWTVGRELSILLEASGVGRGGVDMDELMHCEDSPFEAPPPPAEAVHPLFGLM